MSEIIRFERGAGEIAAPVVLDDGTRAVILGETTVGDYVWPPDELAAFGIDTTRRTIVAVNRLPCCRKCDRIVKHYQMSGDDRLYCAECPEHTFMWYQKRG